MEGRAGNNDIWNEAGKGALYVGGLSVLCLTLKELSGGSGSSFLVSAASVILWMVEFFGCIYLMRRAMLVFRDRFQDVTPDQTVRLGRRIALLSGLLLASAQALFVMQMPQDSVQALFDQIGERMQFTAEQMEQAAAVLDRLPVFTFVFQWLYCWLYGSVLSSILSRTLFLQDLMNRDS